MVAVPEMISVEEAREIVCAHVKPGRIERVGVLDAVGRVLAADVFSDTDVAPFDNSSMDGYAVIAADLEGATEDAPVTLTCVGHIGAGDVFEDTVQPGQTVRIMTGAAVPEGADAVVKVELVTYDGDGSTGAAVRFTAPTKPGNNIRLAGEEAKAGDKICEAGEVVSTAGAGLFASTGNLEVEVYARPVVGLISIGSELVDATEVPGPGMIRNSNIWAMQASVVAAGGVPHVYPTVSDDLDDIRAVYAKAAEECDMVVSTGGACLGDFDLTPGIVRELGEIYVERVNLKPGKSQPFGAINGKPVFVLSGNPAASAIGFELFGRLAMRVMEGHTAIDRPKVQARITCDVRKKDTRVFYERATLSKNADGELEVITLKKQSSGLFGALQKCNCLAIIPESVTAGDMVDCVLFTQEELL